MKRINVATDALLPLPDSANERVLVGMRKFWKMQVAYKSHGLLYKRGVLLWGPPGSGKTATISLLTAELVSMGGLVIYCQIPGVTSIGLEQLRRVEPNRKLICILEDIDEMMQMYGEHDLLALLDGENQVDNIVMVASTNYPERLGARIVNRPARFDERILVGMPSREARRVYLGRIASRLGRDDLSMWVNDTEGFSIAHLRELAAAVLCLEQPYEEVLSRLRSMRIMPKERDAVSSPVGFVPA
jgi:SpoVK/Ycf46/Vps4 family AAA+-type ATPase